MIYLQDFVVKRILNIKVEKVENFLKKYFINITLIFFMEKKFFIATYFNASLITFVRTLFIVSRIVPLSVSFMYPWFLRRFVQARTKCQIKMR